jgi:hypothetical protein
VVSDEAKTAWSCPKDGTAMAQMGRGMGAWRCPECRGIFLDVTAMRRGRMERPPMGPSVLKGIFWSVLATMVVRRLLRRRGSGRGRACGQGGACGCGCCTG